MNSKPLCHFFFLNKWRNLRILKKKNYFTVVKKLKNKYDPKKYFKPDRFTRGFDDDSALSGYRPNLNARYSHINKNSKWSK